MNHWKNLSVFRSFLLVFLICSRLGFLATKSGKRVWIWQIILIVWRRRFKMELNTSMNMEGLRWLVGINMNKFRSVLYWFKMKMNNLQGMQHPTTLLFRLTIAQVSFILVLFVQQKRSFTKKVLLTTQEWKPINSTWILWPILPRFRRKKH